LALLVAAVWWMVRKGAATSPPGNSVRLSQITTTPGLDVGASFSPDGKSFVFSSNKSGKFEIYRKDFASGLVTPVSADGQQNIEPAWSPDGRWIAYHS